jgi:uncharacterized protein (DUF1015 family)
VISPKEQEALYAKDPHNIVRLILGKKQADDSQDSNPHTRAAGCFKQWMESNVLFRNPKSAFYLTAVDFESQASLATRFGIIGLVRLEPFDRGIVLPHERTFSKVKSERLQLMKACHANFSPIFGLYSDIKDILKDLRHIVENQPADMDLHDIHGLRHRLWRIEDLDKTTHITQALSDSRIYIADGHHRYETALNYREWVGKNDPQFSDDHPANYVMMSLSSMEDPGMVIFPAHRLLKDVSDQQMRRFLSRAEDYFDIQIIPVDSQNNQKLDENVRTLDLFLDRHKDKNTIGVYINGDRCIRVMILKKDVMKHLFGAEEPDCLLDLDVTVLMRLIMMDLLGFDQQRLDDESKISYRTSSHGAIKAVRQGEADLAFILNPTKIEQVKRVAEEGLIMPRKSTYFYPKVLSGQVLNLLR